MGFRLHQVVLNNPAGGSGGLADDGVAKPDVYSLVWSSDAAPDLHQEPDSDLRWRGKQTRRGGSSGRRAVHPCRERREHDIMLSHRPQVYEFVLSGCCEKPWGSWWRSSSKAVAAARSMRRAVIHPTVELPGLPNVFCVMMGLNELTKILAPKTF